MHLMSTYPKTQIERDGYTTWISYSFHLERGMISVLILIPQKGHTPSTAAGMATRTRRFIIHYSPYTGLHRINSRTKLGARWVSRSGSCLQSPERSCFSIYILMISIRLRRKSVACQELGAQELFLHARPAGARNTTSTPFTITISLVSYAPHIYVYVTYGWMHKTLQPWKSEAPLMYSPVMLVQQIFFQKVWELYNHTRGTRKTNNLDLADMNWVYVRSAGVIPRARPCIQKKWNAACIGCNFTGYRIHFNDPPSSSDGVLDNSRITTDRVRQRYIFDNSSQMPFTIFLCSPDLRRSVCTMVSRADVPEMVNSYSHRGMGPFSGKSPETCIPAAGK